MLENDSGSDGQDTIDNLIHRHFGKKKRSENLSVKLQFEHMKRR